MFLTSYRVAVWIGYYHLLPDIIGYFPYSFKIHELPDGKMYGNNDMFHGGTNYRHTLVNLMAMKTLWKSLLNVKLSWVVTEVSIKHPPISNEIRFHKPWKPCEKYFYGVFVYFHEVFIYYENVFHWILMYCSHRALP